MGRLRWSSLPVLRCIVCWRREGGGEARVCTCCAHLTRSNHACVCARPPACLRACVRACMAGRIGVSKPTTNGLAQLTEPPSLGRLSTQRSPLPRPARAAAQGARPRRGGGAGAIDGQRRALLGGGDRRRDGRDGPGRLGRGGILLIASPPGPVGRDHRATSIPLCDFAC
jgi:hypothetical protein